MDEPFGALDPITRSVVRREFASLQQRLQTTVVLVTHDMAEAFAIGQRVGVIDEGELLIYDSPAAVAVSSDPRVRALLDTVPPVLISSRERGEEQRTTAREPGAQ
jgi:osmoprotectant transport system ATP-binding protein